MKNFKIKDLMISVHPLLNADKSSMDDMSGMGATAFEASCFESSKCSTTRPDCYDSPSKCSTTRPDCFDSPSKCSTTRPDCFDSPSKCTTTRPHHYFDANVTGKQQESGPAAGLAGLKQLLAGMQANRI